MNHKTPFKSTKYVDTQGQNIPREDNNLVMSALETRYQSICDELSDLLCTVNTDDIILDCNKTYAETLGYSKNDQGDLQ